MGRAALVPGVLRPAQNRPPELSSEGRAGSLHGFDAVPRGGAPAHSGPAGSRLQLVLPRHSAGGIVSEAQGPEQSREEQAARARPEVMFLNRLEVLERD